LACAGAASCVGARSRCGINQAIASSFASDPRKRENRLRKLREMRKTMPAVQASMLLLLAGETLPQGVAGQQNYICGLPGAHLSQRRRQIRLRELRKSLPAVQAFLLLLAGETRPRRVAG
jgi:hypothetical protein